MYKLKIIKKYNYYNIQGKGELCFDNSNKKFIRNYYTTGISTLQPVKIFLIEDKIPKKGEYFLYIPEKQYYECCEWIRVDDNIYLDENKIHKLKAKSLPGHIEKYIELTITCCKKIAKVIKDVDFINQIILGNYKDGDNFDTNLIKIDNEIVESTNSSIEEIDLPKVQFYWNPRYSFTEDFDELGRWARTCSVKNYQIAWVNKIRCTVENEEKIIFSIHGNFPSKYSAGVLISTAQTFEEAKEKVETEFIKFLKAIYE